jgi:CBS domain-containing protein/sporulation protein YlmC with PRC-barrel domain
MALNGLRPSLIAGQIYRLSDLLKRSVFAADKKIGWLEDLVIEDKDIVAEVTHVCIGRPFGDPTLYAPWTKVKLLSGDRMELDAAVEISGLTAAPAGAVLLADYILDKKVLDVEGREVEVVYDAVLAIHRIHLYVIAVDLSRRSMWRRVGLGRLARFFARGESDRIVAWDVVEPLPQKLGSFAGDLRLKVVKEELARMSPTDVARILEELDHDQRFAIFDTMDAPEASDTLEELDPRSQRDLIAVLPKEKAARLVGLMTPGQAADVLSAVSWAQATAVLHHLDKEKAERIREIMNKQEEEVADYVISDFIKFAPDATAQEARQRCREAKNRDAVAYLYVVDAENRLQGVIELADLLRAADQTPLKDIMRARTIFLRSDDSLKEAARVFERYGYRALPVVERTGKLLGIVLSRDVLDLEHHYVE